MKTKTSKATVTHWDGGFTILVPVAPVPASRPRVTRWGTYYTKTYRAYQLAMHRAIPVNDRGLYEGNLRATVQFVCVKPKTTKRPNPKGDIDNHAKAVLDAITGNKKLGLKEYWNDDDQIVELIATKRWARPDEEPHTVITIETGVEADPLEADQVGGLSRCPLCGDTS